MRRLWARLWWVLCGLRDHRQWADEDGDFGGTRTEWFVHCFRCGARLDSRNGKLTYSIRPRHIPQRPP